VAGKFDKMVNTIHSYPYHVFIDRGGKIIAIQEGYDEKFFKRLDSILIEPTR
jgi:hypothetical protein